MPAHLCPGYWHPAHRSERGGFMYWLKPSHYSREATGLYRTFVTISKFQITCNVLGCIGGGFQIAGATAVRILQS